MKGVLHTMPVLFTVVITIVRTLLYAINLAMLLRAILSWLPIDEDNRLLVALCMVTEPLIHPVRVFLDRFESVRHMPFDIAFMVTSILIFVALFLIG
jgi:YggT family protein